MCKKKKKEKKKYVFCCFVERPAGQFVIRERQFFKLWGFFNSLLAITEWHILEYNLGS